MFEVLIVAVAVPLVGVCAVSGMALLGVIHSPTLSAVGVALILLLLVGGGMCELGRSHQHNQ